MEDYINYEINIRQGTYADTGGNQVTVIGAVFDAHTSEPCVLFSFEGKMFFESIADFFEEYEMVD